MRTHERLSPRMLQRLFSLSISFISTLLILNFLLAGVSVAQEDAGADLGLSSSEKAWLAEHQEIRLAVDIDWAPFEFVDDHKQYRGMAAEYIRLVEKRLGITFKVDKERPWPKMVEAVKNHDLDTFSLVVRTPQRDEFVNFTKPYISFPMIIVTLDDKPYVVGIEALRNRTVAVVKSYASHDLLAMNHPYLKLHPTDNVRKGLEAISNGQTYAFVGNLAVVSQVIREAGITNLKIAGQTPYRFELSMAVRKDWPELIPILQKALDSISSKERDQIYNRWISVKFQGEVDYRIVFAVIVVGLLIVLLILIWNRSAIRESEQRFKDFSNVASDWFWETDEKNRFSYFSDQFEIITGISPDTLLGKKREDSRPSGIDDKAWQALLDNMAAHRNFRYVTFSRQRPNGEDIWMRVSGMPHFDNSGHFNGYRCTGTDITKEKQEEQELRKLSHTLEQSPSMIFVTDVEGNIEYINPMFTKISGYAADEVIGNNPRILKSGETPLDIYADLWRTIKSGHDWRGELKDRRKDGSTFWAYAIISPVKNEKGEITNFVSMHEDITQRKEIEIREHKAKKQAEMANRSKSELLANMSHELRTPLNAIIGFSDSMKQETFGPVGSDKNREYLDDIHHSGQHLLELINDILDVSAIEAGALELHEENVNLIDVVEVSGRLIRARAEAGQVSVTPSIDPEIPWIYADARRVKQVFLNLLSNAVKFTPEDGEITVNAWLNDDGSLAVAVADNGIGMDEEEVTKALSKFGLVDSGLDRKQ